GEGVLLDAAVVGDRTHCGALDAAGDGLAEEVVVRADVRDPSGRGGTARARGGGHLCRGVLLIVVDRCDERVRGGELFVYRCDEGVRGGELFLGRVGERVVGHLRLLRRR